MTDDKKTHRGSQIGTDVTTTTEADPTPDLAALTPEEEKVLRMLHGLSESGDHGLRFAVGANAEARAKLALMEKNLLEAFGWGEMASFDVEDRHVEAKERIIDRLKDV